MSRTIRADERFLLLLVDDDPDIHELVAGILFPQNIDIISVTDGEQAVKVALREKPGLILLDYELPSTNGLQVLARLQACAALNSTPIVIITGNDSHKILTACFQAGAADYIRKPFCAAELIARIRSLFDRKQMLFQLQKLADRDTLTGLYNRRSIHEQIQETIDRVPSRSFAVLFLDFDRFKLVNDTLGHDVGDQLLQKISCRLCAELQSRDGVSLVFDQCTAARLGGDEFAILLENLSAPDDALAIAEQLLTTLAEPYDLAGYQVYCTASIGVVTSAQSHTTAAEVLRDADAAMYEAKAAGKGRYVLFDRGMYNAAEQRLRLDAELRVAIANEELFLLYQPIVSLETGRATGFEALVRWNHPVRGLVMPCDFLPLAEETGLIVPIGTWVIHRACRDFAAWQRTLGDTAPSCFHVNLSRKQLLLQNLVEIVGNALELHAIDPKCLHLEVTENEIMQDPEVAKAMLVKLRKLGVKIDMDDFGTGHSSLACLQDVPLDVLKIDRSFIANMERSRNFAALVYAVTTMVQNLGLTAVAEGIETQKQLAMLQSMDCELGQGYFFSKPIPADEVKAYLCQPVKSGFSRITGIEFEHFDDDSWKTCPL